jgi:hypothetical protein
MAKRKPKPPKIKMPLPAFVTPPQPIPEEIHVVPEHVSHERAEPLKDPATIKCIATRWVPWAGSDYIILTRADDGGELPPISENGTNCLVSFLPPGN